MSCKYNLKASNHVVGSNLPLDWLGLHYCSQMMPQCVFKKKKKKVSAQTKLNRLCVLSPFTSCVYYILD